MKVEKGKRWDGFKDVKGWWVVDSHGHGVSFHKSAGEAKKRLIRGATENG